MNTSNLTASAGRRNTSAANISTIDDELKSNLSPLRNKNIRYAQYLKLRECSIKNRIKSHAIILLALTIDALLFKNTILSYLLINGSLPSIAVLLISTILIAYFVIVLTILLVDLKFPNAQSKISSILQDRNGTPKKLSKNESLCSPITADSSFSSKPAADLSWVDAHKFGSPNKCETSIKYGPANASHNYASSANISSLNETSSQIFSPSSASFRKLTDSIHTRKQLDVLLKSREEESHVNPNTTQSSYLSSVWNIFDFGRNTTSSLNNSYQLSEETTSHDSTYNIRIGKNGKTEVKYRKRLPNGQMDETEEEEDDLAIMRKMLNASTASTESKQGILKRSNSMERGTRGIRRRSHSSPERGTVTDQESRHRIGELLSEQQQKSAEFRVRAWIRNTILVPLAKEIDNINKLLEQEHFSPPVQIGKSSIDALKLAIMEKDSLKSSRLPMILPFLSVHSNQNYIVNRIKELSAAELMEAYKWNSGGCEPTEDKLEPKRLVRREWNETFPTDATLLFDLFCTYMDTRINSNCLVGEYRIDQPFTARYVLKYPKKPESWQKLPSNFFINVTALNPPHFEFVHVDLNGSLVKSSVARQSSNLFRVIAQFIHHVKEENHGYIDLTNLGPTGINLLHVLN